MNTPKISYILFSLLLISCNDLLAQDEAVLEPEVCSVMISAATGMYNEGHYEACIDQLKRVLSECDLSRNVKEEAMELLAKSYVEINDQKMADRSVEALLKEYPHYELNERENYESYNRLIKKYRIHPLFSVGARNVLIWIGYNTANFVEMPTGAVAINPYNGGNYFFSYYGWAELEFDNNISLNGDLMWWTCYFEKSYTKEPDFDLFYSENPVFVEIPVYMKKYFSAGSNLKPYVAAGIGWLYMTEAKGYASKYNRNERIRYWNSDIDVIDMRTRHNFEWVAGAGLGYKIKNLRFFIDARYYGGLTSLSDPEHGDVNELLFNDYFYTDSPLKLNKFEIGVSISYAFINSVKRIK